MAFETPIPEFLEAEKSVADWVAGYLEDVGRKDQENLDLYHYTSASGLKGIVESDCIWFTDIRHLNDPAEFMHGHRIAEEELERALKTTDKVVEFFLKFIPDRLRKARLKSDTFIASFSRNPNELGQWRAYGDNARGFSVGFGRDMFIATTKAAHELPVRERFFLASVDYDSDSVRAKQRSAIEKVVSVLSSPNVRSVLNENNFKPLFVELSVHLCTVLMWNCLTAKHGAYSVEAEVRWLLHANRDLLKSYVKTRVRGTELITYIPIPLNPSLKVQGSLKSILVGPAAYDGAQESVRRLLLSAQIDPGENSVLITKSDIPYRAF